MRESVSAVPETAPLPEASEVDDHEDQYGEFPDTVDQPEGSHVEYGTEVPADEPSEVLDADTVHEAADAEDGGDYTEYAENLADDDGQYDGETTEEYDEDAEANVFYVDAEGVPDDETEEYTEDVDDAPAEEEPQDRAGHLDGTSHPPCNMNGPLQVYQT